VSQLVYTQGQILEILGVGSSSGSNSTGKGRTIAGGSLVELKVK